MLRTLVVRTLVTGALIAVVASATSAATRTWSGGGNDNNWTTPLNWVGGVAPVAGDALVFDGFSKLATNSNNLTADTNIAGLTFAPTAGAFTLSGNRITLGGDIVDNTTNLTQTINLALLLSGTRDVSVVGQGLTLIGGNISGGFGLNKTGDGTLTLSGTNTFTGPLTIAAGTVSVSNDNQLGAVPGSPTAGRLVIDGTNGTLRTTATMTINANRGIALGPNVGSGDGIIRVLNGLTTTYGGVMANNGAGSGGLTKLNFGGLTLSGANTYSGPTAIQNGTVTLDFAAAGAPASNVINSVSSLTLGGANAGLGGDSFAALTMTAAATGGNTQTFSGTTIDTGLNRITINKPATSGSNTLNLGALNHNVGSHLVLAYPTAGSGTATIKTTTSNTNGILGGWATIGTGTVQRGVMLGTDWATVDGSGNIVPYTGYTAASPYDGSAGTLLHGNVTAANNVRLPAAAAPEATEVRVNVDDAGTTTDINTWAWENVPGTTTTGHVLTIGRGNTLRLGANGGIFRQSTANNRNFYIGSAAGGGIQTGNGASGSQNIGNLTAGGAPNTPGEIVVTVNNDSQTSGSGIIAARIVDNGTGAVKFIKAGSGALKIDGNNTYSGGTWILGGRLQLAGSELGTTDPNNPAVGNPDGLGTGPVTIVPGGQLFASGINPDLNATDNITPSANDAVIANNFFLAGSGTQQEALGAIRLGNRSNMTGQITLIGDARIGGGNTPTYNLNATEDVLTITPGNILSGKITGNFNMDFGAAASIATNVTLANSANDWTGDTTLLGRTGGTASTTRVNLGAHNVIPDGVGKGNVLFGNATNTNSPIILDMQGFNETINGLSTAPSANVNNNIIENNGWSATVDTSGGANAYAYVFTAKNATLTVGNNDQTATFAGIIRDNEGATSLTLPNPNFDPQDPTPDPDPATISVTNPAFTTGSKLAITKIGNGTQTLSGANTYTGATTVNGGVLSVTGSLAAASPITVNSGGAIGGAGDGFTTGKVGNVTVTSGGRVAPGSTGPGTIGTLTMSSLSVASGDVHIDFNGANKDLVDVQGSVSFSGANTITPFGTPSAGTYTVIQSTSAITGAGTLTLNPFPNIPNTRGASGTLNLTDPTAVKINVTGGAKSLTWIGNVNNEWDLVGDSNWNDGAISEKFFNADAVTFNNTSSNNNPVELVGDLAPSTVTVNATRNYTFAGAGSITGNTTLTKDGTGTLTVSNANSYAGTTTINGGTLVVTNTSGSPLGSGAVLVANSNGTLQIGNGGTSGSLGTNAITNDGIVIINRSDAHTVSNAISGSGEVRHTGTGVVTLSGTSTHTGTVNIQSGTVKTTNSGSLGATNSGTVNISAGATLDVGGSTTTNNTAFGTRQFFIVGTGVGGQGAIINSNAANGQQNAFSFVTLTGNATVGAYGRFDLRANSPVLDLAGFTLTKKGTDHFGIVAGTITDGNIIVEEGNLALEGATSVFDAANGNKITFQNGTRLQFFGTTGGIINRPMEFNGNVNVHQNSGANTVSNFDSPVTLKGTATFTFQNTGQTVTAGGVISDDATPRGIVVDITPQPGTLVLTGNNTYKGNTTVRGNGTTGSILTLQPGSGISDLGNTSTVTVEAGALLNLNFSNTDVIGSLFLAGSPAAIGKWGAPGSIGFGADFESALLGGFGLLQVTSAGLPGDFNNDGKVDAADYVVWRKTIGTQAKYDEWRSNFGAGGPGSAASANQSGAVPEPAAVLLAIVAGALVVAGRRRRV